MAVRLFAHVCKLAVLAVLFGPWAPAQFIGYTSPQTVTQLAFNAQACSGVPVSFNVRNIGQSVHYVLYRTAGTVTSLSLQIEASDDNTNWFRISDTANTTTDGGISASLYLPLIRVRITACTGTGTITATYTGTSVANGPPLGIFATNSSWNKDVATNRPANANATFSLPLPKGGTGGAIYFTFSDGTCTGSTISVTAGPNSTRQIGILAATSLAATANTQAFSIPALPANVATITYTTGCGASSATYDLSFALGENIVTATSTAIASGTSTVTPSAAGITCNKFAVVSFTAGGAGATQIVTSVAGGTRITLCHFSASLSAGQSVQLQYGTGVNCATGTTNLTGPYQNVATIALDGLGPSLATAVNTNLCANVGGATTVGGLVLYAET